MAASMFFSPASEFASRMCASTLSGFIFNAFSARTFASSNLPARQQQVPRLHLHVVALEQQVGCTDVLGGSVAAIACLPEGLGQLQPDVTILRHRLNGVAILDAASAILLLADVFIASTLVLRFERLRDRGSMRPLPKRASTRSSRPVRGGRLAGHCVR